MNSGKCQNEALQIEPFDMVLTKAYFWLTTIDLLRRTWFLHKDLFLEMSRKNARAVFCSSKVSISTIFILYVYIKPRRLELKLKYIQEVICYVSLINITIVWDIVLYCSKNLLSDKLKSLLHQDHFERNCYKKCFCSLFSLWMEAKSFLTLFHASLKMSSK